MRLFWEALSEALTGTITLVSLATIVFTLWLVRM